MKNKLTLRRKLRENAIWYSFLIPSIAAIIFFVYKPMISTLFYSFTNVQVYGGDYQFNGLKNYYMLLTSRVFLKVLYNTFALCFLGLLTIPLGFILANAINSLGKGKMQSFFRVAFYLPNIITGVSVVLVFICVLKGQGGLLNQAISAIVGHKVTISWLGDPKYSHIGATIIYVWMNLGYAMLINLANLQAIPNELYEAAQIDSANRWQCMRYITIPSMKPCFSFLLITTMISGLSRFSDLFVIGGNTNSGQPDNTLQTIMMYIYKYSFDKPDYGISSAGAIILFILVMIFTIVNLKISNFLKEN